MSSARILSSLLAAVIALCATTAGATLIVVSDASNTTGNSAIFDRSTDGDTAAGVSAMFSTNESVFPGADFFAWDGNRNFLSPFAGPVGTATWTFSGLTSGSVFDVYASWVAQGNLSTVAPYSINGGTAITKNQTVAPSADLVLMDAAAPSAVDFEFIGQGTVDGLGNITISATEATAGPVGAVNFIKLDAIAISAVSAVPEVSAAIAMPFVMGLVGFGKMSRRRRRENREEMDS